MPAEGAREAQPKQERVREIQEQLMELINLRAVDTSLMPTNAAEYKESMKELGKLLAEGKWPRARQYARIRGIQRMEEMREVREMALTGVVNFIKTSASIISDPEKQEEIKVYRAMSGLADLTSEMRRFSISMQDVAGKFPEYKAVIENAIISYFDSTISCAVTGTRVDAPTPPQAVDFTIRMMDAFGIADDRLRSRLTEKRRNDPAFAKGSEMMIGKLLHIIDITISEDERKTIAGLAGTLILWLGLEEAPLSDIVGLGKGTLAQLRRDVDQLRAYSNE